MCASPMHLRTTCVHRPTLCRTIMTASLAFTALGLSDSGRRVSAKELKDAYFTKAKECHPDSNLNTYPSDSTSRFVHLTNAYEFLRYRVASEELDIQDSSTVSSTISEDEDYRKACMTCLGLSAEMVEESKRCPLFRQWLRGRSDSAMYWNSFLMLHGGLAPRPQSRILWLSPCEASNNNDIRRRRRKDK